MSMEREVPWDCEGQSWCGSRALGHVSAARQKAVPSPAQNCWPHSVVCGAGAGAYGP